ncbi:hypothetical protein [Budvicia diplopodorum]|uniref:hypothetical protein n=1 Tax=Budvicia diplopodorum TaxID=1119056 RepID=UPI00135A3AE4|nr:hypothetical protein [Budvicia diplopodorum]
MTIQTGKDIKEKVIIRDSDIRRLNFYEEYMRSNHSFFNLYRLANNCNAINESLVIVYPDLLERKAFVDKMRAACNKVILPKKEFNWIKINDRNCFWAWLMIRDIRNKDLPLYTNLFDSKTPPIYDQLPINKIPASTIERYNAIVEFFDILRTDVRMIRVYFYHLRIKLQKVYTFSTSFLWIKKENKKQCEWAWDYMKRSGVIIKNENILTPISKKEMYFTIIAAFDSWFALDSEKELFLIKMKKAWSQKKYRDEVSDQKLLNTYISQNAKDKLDKMTAISKRKINEMIELMIDNEYKKYQ